MSRRTLTDTQWARIEPLIPGKKGNRERTAHCWFRRWTQAGVWASLFKTLSCDPDLEYLVVDATICKAYADASAQKGR